MDEPLQDVLGERVGGIKGSTTRLAEANVSAREGNNGLSVGLGESDMGVVLVGVDVEVEWLDSILLCLHGGARSTRETARIDVGLVEGLEDEALGEIGHSIGRGLFGRRLRRAVDALEERCRARSVDPFPGRSRRRWHIIAERGRVGDGTGCLERASGDN